jgi:PIN domain nuclease of toxin-antitoxin system
VTYLDTNAVIFLHTGGKKLSQKARLQIDMDDVIVSSMVLLELEMLREKGVLKIGAEAMIGDLAQSIGLSVCQLPMSRIIQHSLSLGWTRDPGDRLIVANAIAANESPLVSSDRMIKEHYRNTIW